MARLGKIGVEAPRNLAVRSKQIDGRICAGRFSKPRRLGDALTSKSQMAPEVARRNGLRIRQFDGQVPVLRGFLRWSTQFCALFVRARGRTGDGPQHVGLLDLIGPLAEMIAGVDRSGQEQLTHGSDLL